MVRGNPANAGFNPAMDTSPPPPLDPPERLLLGPGPSEVPPEVLRALGRPLLGHLDPAFLGIMDETAAMLRAVFGTDNETTLPVSGTGSAGIEALFQNLVEPGDRILVGVHGVFGQRMAEMARRAGGEVEIFEAPWGRALDPEEAARRLRGGGFRALALVHAETSTGVHTPLAPFGQLAREHGLLFLVDTVTSLGGMPVELDRNGVDAAASGSQKCLSCPPGLAPLSLGPAARERLQARRRPVRSWYLDLGLVTSYWGGERAYHHTAPISMIYALHEALRLCLEEGLAARYERHRRVSRGLLAGLAALGLEPLVPEAERLPQLTAVRVPEGVDDGRVRRRLLLEHGIEIGGGLGPLAGRAWRIGLLGASCLPAHVARLLPALAACLRAEGRNVPPDEEILEAAAAGG